MFPEEVDVSVPTEVPGKCPLILGLMAQVGDATPPVPYTSRLVIGVKPSLPRAVNSQFALHIVAVARRGSSRRNRKPVTGRCELFRAAVETDVGLAAHHQISELKIVASLEAADHRTRL